MDQHAEIDKKSNLIKFKEEFINPRTLKKKSIEEARQKDEDISRKGSKRKCKLIIKRRRQPPTARLVVGIDCTSWTKDKEGIKMHEAER